MALNIAQRICQTALAFTVVSCGSTNTSSDSGRIARLVEECATFPELMKRYPVKDFNAFGAALYGGRDGIRRAMNHMVREVRGSGATEAEIADYAVRLAGAMYGFLGGAAGTQVMQGIDQQALRGFLREQGFTDERAEVALSAISTAYEGAGRKCPMRR